MSEIRSWIRDTVSSIHPGIVSAWPRIKWLAYIGVVCVMIAFWLKPTLFGVKISVAANEVLAILLASLAHWVLFHPLYTNSRSNEFPADLPFSQHINYMANIVEEVVFYLTLAIMVAASMNLWGVGLG